MRGPGVGFASAPTSCEKPPPPGVGHPLQLPRPANRAPEVGRPPAVTSGPLPALRTGRAAPRPNLRRLAGSAFSVGARARSAPSFPPLWAARSSKRQSQSGSGGRRPSVARRTSGEGCSLRARGRKSTLRLSSLIGPGGQSQGMCAGTAKGHLSPGPGALGV